MAIIAVHTAFKCLIVFATLSVSMPALSADDVTSYLDAIESKMDPRAAAVIDQLDGTGRQLLAAISYLRRADSLTTYWSWTQQQIDVYQGSPAQQRLDADIDCVRREFELKNPGFTLFVNPNVRSLDVQIEQWNSNGSVAAAAENLLNATTVFLASSAIARASTAVGRDSFANFLLDHEPSPLLTIAAPGLSPHGQMRAVDFHIESAGMTVAGPDSTTIESEWLQAGWRDKLSAAVIASGAPFDGPLENPNEPWHYTYRRAVEMVGDQDSK